jgi:hypothetical protein
MSWKSVAFVLSILAFSRPSAGLQLWPRGLRPMTSSQEFEYYRSSPEAFPNATEIKYENIGPGVATFEVDAGHNFSLFCTGPRMEGHWLGWTSNSLQFHSEVGEQ